ncbi:hypothetical protein [Chlamydia vaughanii]|uniref:hypothetical protein n=1 Tax=Chlamydia vaughanii TaxID=3112552 RepID=UPI0039F47F33
MKCIPACFTLQSERREKCLIRENASKACLVANVFSILLSLLVASCGVGVLVVFSTEIGLVVSIVLGMSVVASLIFLAVSFYYLANRDYIARTYELNEIIAQEQEERQRLSCALSNSSVKCTQLEERCKAIGSLENELAGSMQRITVLDEEHGRLSSRIIELEEQISQNNQSHLLGECRRFQSREEALTRDFEEKEKELQESINDLERIVVESRTESSQLRRLITDLEEQQKDEQQDNIIKGFTSQLEEKEEQIQRLETTLETTCSELSQLQSSLQEEEVRKQEIVGLRGETDVLKQERNNLLQERSQLQLQLESLRDSLSRGSTVLEQGSQETEESNRELLARIRGLENVILQSTEEQKVRDEAFKKASDRYEQKIAELEHHNRMSTTSIAQGETMQFVLGSAAEGENLAMDAELVRQLQEAQMENTRRQEKIDRLEQEIIQGTNQKRALQRLYKKQIASILERQEELNKKLAKAKQKERAAMFKVRELNVLIGRICNRYPIVRSTYEIRLTDEEYKLAQDVGRVAELTATIERLRAYLRTIVNAKKVTGNKPSAQQMEVLRGARRELQLTVDENIRMVVSQTNHRIDRLKAFSRGTSLEHEVATFVKESEKALNYEALQELETQLFEELYANCSSGAASYSVGEESRLQNSMRAIRLVEFGSEMDGFRERVEWLNARLGSSEGPQLLYELEQEVLEHKEVELFSLREAQETMEEQIFNLEHECVRLREELACFEGNQNANQLAATLQDQEPANSASNESQAQLLASRQELAECKRQILDAKKSLLKISLEKQTQELELGRVREQLNQLAENQ